MMILHDILVFGCGAFAGFIVAAILCAGRLADENDERLIQSIKEHDRGEI